MSYDTPMLSAVKQAIAAAIPEAKWISVRPNGATITFDDFTFGCRWAILHEPSPQQIASYCDWMTEDRR